MKTRICIDRWARLESSTNPQDFREEYWPYAAFDLDVDPDGKTPVRTHVSAAVTKQLRFVDAQAGYYRAGADDSLVYSWDGKTLAHQPFGAGPLIIDGVTWSAPARQIAEARVARAKALAPRAIPREKK